MKAAESGSCPNVWGFMKSSVKCEKKRVARSLDEISENP